MIREGSTSTTLPRFDPGYSKALTPFTTEILLATSGSISIGGLNKISKYEIYTSLGQMVQRGRVLNGTIELNDAGIYFVRVFVDDRWIVNTVVVLN